MSKEHKGPREFATLVASCPVRQQTLAGEERTPAFLQLATKAAAVATAALTTAPEAPKTVRPILTSARSVTRTGYLATKAVGGSGRNTLLAGVALAIVGIVLASAGWVVVGLTGTVIALVGLYLIAVGAWGIHRGLLGALIGFTALLLVGALTLPWVRTELWGTNGNSKAGLVPQRCPAVAAGHLVGGAGAARRPAPAVRPAQHLGTPPTPGQSRHGAPGNHVWRDDGRHEPARREPGPGSDRRGRAGRPAGSRDHAVPGRAAAPILPGEGPDRLVSCRPSRELLA